MQNPDSKIQERPPVVTVVGHIDHGKSTLLDYIRKTNVVAGEAGGITQHLSAYEVVHPTKTQNGETVNKKITFLDTPGHEAFQAMRSRGLNVADIAILVVSAEEGAKPQTLEALHAIEEAKIPYIVALTKIDRPEANLPRAKMSLVENGVYLEGMGGAIPSIGVSGKTGEGVSELLDLLLLAAELEDLTADATLPGEGLVIEAHVDNKRGNTATLIVQNGSIRSGEYIVCGESFAPVRIMENFLGKSIKEALPGSPARVVGFSTLPAVGAPWKTVESKKEAESDVAEARATASQTGTETHTASPEDEEKVHLILPVIIKTDFAGSGDAVVHELEKLPKDERLEIRIVSRSVGPISEGDVRLVGSGKHPGVIVGFNVKIEKEGRELAERLGVEIATFDIIYKLTEWFAGQLASRTPREKTEENKGSAKILKVFSSTKGRVVLGGRVESGTIAQGGEVKIMRRDLLLGRGEIVSLQTHKVATKTVEIGTEFGAMLKTDVEPAPGDHIEAFEVVEK